MTEKYNDQISVSEALQKLADEKGKHFTVLFEHGTLKVENNFPKRN